jgi:tetratricopeptide (TPR) repeat protein
MRGLSVLLCLVAMTAPRIAAAQVIDPDEEAAHRHYGRGLTHYDAGRYDAALTEFEAVKRFRDSPALDYNIARCYDRLERYPEAVAAYERYVTQKPDAADAAETRERIATLRKRLEPPPGSQREAAPPPPPIVTAAAPPTVAAADAPPSDEGAQPRPRRRYVAPIAIGAGAVVAAAVGAGLLGSVKSDYDSALGPSGCRPCSNSQISPLENRALAGYVLLGAAGALVVIDVALIGVMVARGKRPSHAEVQRVQTWR